MEGANTFGQWLNRQRKARDLTQEDLAERIGCSLWTIQKIEVGSRHPSKQVAELLADYFNIPAESRPAFLQFARGRAGTRTVGNDWREKQATVGDVASKPEIFGGLAPPAPNLDRSNNLPGQLTSFIGREAELARLVDLLVSGKARLVTLTGPPGIGKTRLALQVARVLLDTSPSTFPDGVFFVPLAPIQKAELVASTIARALGVRDPGHERSGDGDTPMEAMSRALRNKQMLLLLDNFEQLLGPELRQQEPPDPDSVAGAPLVERLLTVCPHLKALVTSREPLHVQGEQQFPVLPLDVPHFDDTHADLHSALELNDIASVELFVERAQAVRPDFALGETNVEAVAAICARLEGIPLAIELAAARTKMLTPPEVLTLLDRRLKLLTGGPKHLPVRQQTLRGAIDWSCDLLDPAERTLFRRLGVFAGGATLSAVQAVCNAQNDLPDVLDRVASLLDKSLLRQEVVAQGHSRFTMLEMIREYALEVLRESWELDTIRHYHAEYFLALAEAAEPELRGPDQEVWLDRLEEEHDNLRAVLEWSQSLDVGVRDVRDVGVEADGGSEGTAAIRGMETGLRLAAALGTFWYLRGYYTEGRRRLESAIFQAEQVIPTEREAGEAQVEPGAVGVVGVGEHSAQRMNMLRQACAKAFSSLSWLVFLQADYVAARSLIQQGLAYARASNDKALVTRLLHNLAGIADETGDYASARVLYREGLQISRESGNEVRVWAALANLGWLDALDGNFDLARPQLDEAAAMARQIGGKHELAATLTLSGLQAYYEGDYGLARVRCEQSLAMTKEMRNKQEQLYALLGVGMTALREGNYDEAEALLTEGLRLARDLGSKKDFTWCLPALAGVASARRQPERAARLFAATEAICEAIGHKLWPVQRAEVDRDVASVRAQLDRATWEKAWTEGRAMWLEEAVRYALEAGPSTLSVDHSEIRPLLPSAGKTYKGLTRRECEVAALIAQSKSNTEIAETLVVSKRTVATHLTNILSKLGFTSRGQVAAWALREGLA